MFSIFLHLYNLYIAFTFVWFLKIHVTISKSHYKYKISILYILTLLEEFKYFFFFFIVFINIIIY